MKRHAFAVLLMLTAAMPAVAEQKLSTRPNGTVKIAASPTEVTRISVIGDRIRRIIRDETRFDEINDETTGDIFLRYDGPQDKLVPETGYILTEKGVTIGYELTPRVNLGAETVVISVTGGTGAAVVPAGRSTAGNSSAAAPFELAAGEGGGGYSSNLVAFTRATINKHIAGKAPPSRSHGTTIATESGSGGMRARILVAAGGRTGRYVRPQDFYGSRVLAVWVQRNNLSPNERAWIIVVEKR